MGLFSNMYKPGPGVSPNTPRKAGLARLMEILGRDMGPFFKAGMLAIISALPFLAGIVLAVVTHALIFVIAAGIVGGALAAPQIVGVADTILRSLRDEPGFWWHTYRRAWKNNARAALLPGALFGLIFGGEIFLFVHLADMEASAWIIVMLLAGALLSLGLSAYVWAQIALVDVPFFTMLKNAVFLFLAYLPASLGSMAVLAIYWGAVVLLFPLSAPVLLFTNFWVPMVPSTLIIYKGLNNSFKIEETLDKRRKAAEDAAGSSDAD